MTIYQDNLSEWCLVWESRVKKDTSSEAVVKLSPSPDKINWREPTEVSIETNTIKSFVRAKAFIQIAGFLCALDIWLVY